MSEKKKVQRARKKPRELVMCEIYQRLARYRYLDEQKQMLSEGYKQLEASGNYSVNQLADLRTTWGLDPETQKNIDAELYWAPKKWRELREKALKSKIISVQGQSRRYQSLDEVNRDGWVVREHIERDDPPYKHPNSKFSLYLNGDEFIERATLEIHAGRLIRTRVYRLRRGRTAYREILRTLTGGALSLFDASSDTSRDQVRAYMRFIGSSYMVSVDEKQLLLMQFNLLGLVNRLYLQELGHPVPKLDLAGGSTREGIARNEKVIEYWQTVDWLIKKLQEHFLGSPEAQEVFKKLREDKEYQERIYKGGNEDAT